MADNRHVHDHPASEMEFRTPALREARNELWALLDDIDTYSDSCRNDDAAFRKLVYATQRKRFHIYNPEGFPMSYSEIHNAIKSGITTAQSALRPDVPRNESVAERIATLENIVDMMLNTMALVAQATSLAPDLAPKEKTDG